MWDLWKTLLISRQSASCLSAAFCTGTNERAGLGHRLLHHLVRVKPLRRWPSRRHTHTWAQAAIGFQLRSKPVLALASIGSSCASPSSGAIIHCRASRGKRFPIFIASTRVRAESEAAVSTSQASQPARRRGETANHGVNPLPARCHAPLH